MQLKPRFQAAGIHLCISLVIAALAATLVFALWYPYPYRDLSGGRELFTMLVSIDVILGPLLTLAVFNLKKPRAELVRDLAIIGLVQLLALGYGLWTVYQARPVHMVFEMDRFRVTHAADIDPELLAKAPPSLQALPNTGPTTLAVRPLLSDEKFSITMAALNGAQMAFRPDLWQPYDAARADIPQHRGGAHIQLKRIKRVADHAGCDLRPDRPNRNLELVGANRRRSLDRA